MAKLAKQFAQNKGRPVVLTVFYRRTRRGVLENNRKRPDARYIATPQLLARKWARLYAMYRI